MSLWLLKNHHETIWKLGSQIGAPPQPRGLIVTECPGATNPKTPLFPNQSTPNSSACRLLRMSKMTLTEYLGNLICVNQCMFDWSIAEANDRYRLMIKWLIECDRPMRVLLLGGRIQSVWGVNNLQFGYERFSANIQITWAPAPVGTCRVYKKRINEDRLRRRLRWTAGLSVS